MKIGGGGGGGGLYPGLRKSAATAGAVASAATAATTSNSFFMLGTPELLFTDAPLAAQDDQTTSGLLQRGHIFSDFALDG
jgi:hypothetical protein